MTIRNIIFDLGGVIINIDYNRTKEAFNRLGASNFDSIYSKNKQDCLIDQFDVGKITSDQFRNGLKNKLNLSISDDEFDAAWNAMLLDIPQERLDYIKQLRNRYKVFLFSNTNDIHLSYISNLCVQRYGFTLFKDYFDREYYSNIFGMRKPNPESFVAILRENNMLADETLFIDDTLEHVQGAKQADINAIHLLPGKEIFDIDICGCKLIVP